MKTNEVEKRIKESFSKKTPDLLDRIMQSCERERQEDGDTVRVIPRSVKLKRSIIKYSSVAASFILIFTFGILLGTLININSQPGDATAPQLDIASVYIDVNPSIEMVVDEDGIVRDVLAANSDAEAVLQGMELSGVKIKTALNAVIGAMYMNGYFADDSGAFLVSMSADADAKFETLLSTIVDDVTEIVESSGRTCSIVAQDFDADDDTIKLAEENSISPGKMSLIEKIIGFCDEYTENDIPDLSNTEIKDLNEIYAFLKSTHDKDNGGDKEGHKDDIISGALGWMDNDKTSALEFALSALSEMLDSVVGEDMIRNLKIDIKHEHDKGGHGFIPKFIYRISFSYAGEYYSYDVNLSDGTVIERENDREEIKEEDEGKNDLSDIINGDKKPNDDNEKNDVPDVVGEGDKEDGKDKDKDKDKGDFFEDIFSGLVDDRP